MGRKSNTQQRREQIVQSLYAEMADCGYERASIKSIAQRAGLAPGLVHYHFRDKEEVLLVLLDQLIIDVDLRYRDAAAKCNFPGDQLRAYAQSRLGFGGKVQARQVQAWVSIMSEVVAQPPVRHRVSSWMDKDHSELSELFRRAGSESPVGHASMLLTIVLGAFSLHAIGVNGVTPGYALDQALDWLDQVLG